LNFYEILEVNHRASDDDIRKAFRRLARLYHPDVSTDPEAPDRFRLVYMAYDILQDRRKRALYDELQIMREAQERFSHEADVRAWQRHAARSANTYAEMSFDEFQDTFLSRLGFHSSQVFAFIMFFILLCIGCIGIMAGTHFLFAQGFNGHTLLGYMLLGFGAAFAYTAAKAIWDILQVWHR
jgi:hypothetical protein